MSVALDHEKLVINACVAEVTKHIETRLAQTNTRLARGNASGLAAFIVQRWSLACAKAFYVLASQADRFVSHSEIIKGCGINEKTWRGFWKRLRAIEVNAQFVDTKEAHPVALFRRGREMFWSASGVKLTLSTRGLPFDLGKKVTDDTMASTVAARQNYDGAAAAQRADESRSESERTAATTSIESAVSHEGPSKKQADLFPTKAANS